MKAQEVQEIKYDAFISYRHAQPDQFVAETLHKQLEMFRLPGNVRRKLEDKGKTRINRVFRDKEELPIASNLADPITEALSHSDFLIVLCSPRLLESQWCKKEIETFIAMHGRERVLAVLVEGEPADSFPEALLYAEVEETQSDGSVIKKKVPVEPLAADVRGNDKREIKKKMKEEVLRLAAPMFGCAYDDLKQRHRERRMRRILGVSLGISAFCLLFGTISTSMAMKIHGQNLQIAKQSQEIEQQYQESLRSNAISESDAALQLLEKGDRLGAINKAYAVLPDTKESVDKPYTAQAEYALSKSLYLYENNRRVLSRELLVHDTAVSVMKLSPEKDTLLCVDQFGIIYVWELATGNKLCEIRDYTGAVNSDEESVAYVNGDVFCYTDGEDIIFYDIRKCEVIQTLEDVDAYALAVSAKANLLAWQGFNSMTVWDMEKQESCFEYQLAEDESFGYEQLFNDDGSLLAFQVELEAGEGEGNTSRIDLFDTKQKKVTGSYALDYNMLYDMCFDEEVLYASGVEDMMHSESYMENGSLLDVALKGKLYACDLNAPGEFRWVLDNMDGDNFYDIRPSSKEGSSVLLAVSFSNIYALDETDGTVTGMEAIGEQLLEAANLVGTDNYFLFTRDGDMLYVKAQGDVEVIIYEEYYQSNSSNVMQVLCAGGGYFISLPYSENEVTVYQLTAGEKVENIQTFDNFLSKSAIKPDGSQLAVSDGLENTVILCDAASGELLDTITQPENIIDLAYIGEKGEYLGVIAGKRVTLYDSATCDVVKEYDIVQWDASFAGNANEYIWMDDYGTLYLLDSVSGEQVSMVAEDENYYGTRASAVNWAGSQYAVTSSEDGTVSICTMGENTAVQQTSINAAYVDNLFFDDKGEKLFVVYKDGKVQLYDTQTMEQQSSYQFEELVKEYVPMENGDYILKGPEESYRLNDKDEVLSVIAGLREVNGQQGQYLLSQSTELYKVPVYDYAMLLEAAKQYITP